MLQLAPMPVALPVAAPMPSAWTPEIEAAARAHTIEAYPNEAAGMVWEGQYVRLENRSTTPTDDVVLSDADLVAVSDADVFFHSHPDGLPCPSASDMIYQQQLGIPFVITTWPVPDFFAFGDGLPKAPLLGRAFRHGVHDCYSLMRDWYLERHGDMGFPDQPRDWEWWRGKNKNLYMDGFTALGFESISPQEAIEPGDVLLFNMLFTMPMHGAVVVDRHLLMHHGAGQRAYDRTRLSVMVPRLRYERHISFALRHKDIGHA
jgi:cell wall-associated NlpC family hydrolase